VSKVSRSHETQDSFRLRIRGANNLGNPLSFFSLSCSIGNVEANLISAENAPPAPCQLLHLHAASRCSSPPHPSKLRRPIPAPPAPKRLLEDVWNPPWLAARAIGLLLLPAGAAARQLGKTEDAKAPPVPCRPACAHAGSAAEEAAAVLQVPTVLRTPTTVLNVLNPGNSARDQGEVVLLWAYPWPQVESWELRAESTPSMGGEKEEHATTRPAGEVHAGDGPHSCATQPHDPWQRPHWATGPPRGSYGAPVRETQPCGLIGLCSQITGFLPLFWSVHWV